MDPGCIQARLGGPSCTGVGLVSVHYDTDGEGTFLCGSNDA